MPNFVFSQGNVSVVIVMFMIMLVAHFQTQADTPRISSLIINYIRCLNMFDNNHSGYINCMAILI